MPSKKSYILLLLSLLCLGHCNANDSFIEAYGDLHQQIFPTDRAIVASQGGIKLSRSNLHYVNSADRLLSHEEIMSLPEGARRLILKKVLLRRLAIAEGLKNDIYADPQALEYILPRVSRILEDYYYHKEANMASIEAEVQKLTPDQAALKELLKNDPRLQQRDLSVADLEREKERLVRRLIRRRMARAREASIARLLKKYPDQEISP